MLARPVGKNAGVMCDMRAWVCALAAKNASREAHCIENARKGMLAHGAFLTYPHLVSKWWCWTDTDAGERPDMKLDRAALAEQHSS